MSHSDPMKDFIRNLNHVRTMNGWTIKDLAVTCGMTREAMSVLLNGHQAPNLTTCVSIAKSLNYGLHELFDPNFKNLVESH